MRCWLTRQFKALADRISDLSYAKVEYHPVADESTTGYLAYAHRSRQPCLIATKKFWTWMRKGWREWRDA
jgi:hypothetical protein